MLGFYLKYDMIGCTLALPCFSCRRPENVKKKKKKFERWNFQPQGEEAPTKIRLFPSGSVFKAMRSSWSITHSSSNPFAKRNTWLEPPCFFIPGKFLRRGQVFLLMTLTLQRVLMGPKFNKRLKKRNMHCSLTCIW